MNPASRVVAQKNADEWLDEKVRELERAAPSYEQRKAQADAAWDWLASQTLARLVAIFLAEPWATEAWAQSAQRSFHLPLSLLAGQAAASLTPLCRWRSVQYLTFC